MSTSPRYSIFIKAVILLFCLAAYQMSFAQKDSIQKKLIFNGAINVSNNGFSNIPSFSLGKPATIINITVGGQRTSFEPELRFSLEGKPWSFLFWLRHKLIIRPKYQMTVGIHPGFNFKSENTVINGVESEYIVTRRYLTEELNHNLVINKNISVGLYYMYGLGLDLGTARHTHFLALRASFANIKIAKEVSLRVNPQLFFLNTAYKNGYYFATSVGLFKKNWPVSIGAIMNKKLKSDIVSKDFNWNVSLNYAFGNTYKTVN